MHGLEVTAYQPPWKALSEFALHADFEVKFDPNANSPAFQQLINQVCDVAKLQIIRPVTMVYSYFTT